MLARVPCALFLSMLFASGSLAFAQATQSPDTERHHRRGLFDASLFANDQTLEELELEPETGPVAVYKRNVERRRAGARFAFGTEVARGYVQLFAEEFEWRIPGLPPSMDLGGVGGGVIGAVPFGAKKSHGFRWLVPYRAGIALAGGSEETPGGPDTDIGYLEAQGELGIGFEWAGLRPSVGVLGSSIAGIVDNDAVASEADLTGVNLGGYGELRYHPPSLPIYFRVRGAAGDFELLEFGLGFAF